MSELTEYVDVICGAEAHECKCGREPGHNGAHECSRDGGQWLGDIDGDDFQVLRFPDPTVELGVTPGWCPFCGLDPRADGPAQPIHARGLLA